QTRSGGVRPDEKSERISTQRVGYGLITTIESPTRIVFADKHGISHRLLERASIEPTFQKVISNGYVQPSGLLTATRRQTRDRK
ncbi:hypothetical protein, partial [Pseudomonas quasicaspiana]|uniref:hypothetical protein n=1 Tax=Pseudomonas quasicaspiana TaxID=2829821 RepID=UPI001E452218